MSTTRCWAMSTFAHWPVLFLSGSCIFCDSKAESCLPCEEHTTSAHRCLSHTCKHHTLQVLSCFLSLSNIFSFRAWAWWRGPADWSTSDYVFWEDLHVPGCPWGASIYGNFPEQEMVLVGTEAWDAPGRKDKSVPSAQTSTSIHYFQSFITSFSAAGTVEVSLCFFFSFFLHLDNLNICST